MKLGKIEDISTSQWSRFFTQVEEKRRRSQFVWSSGQIKESLNQELWVQLMADQIAAFAVIQRIDPVAEILFLITLPPFERQGLMKALLRDIGESISKDGQLWLEVHEKNEAAIRLYESTGMKRVGKRPRYYRDGATAYLYSLSNSLPHV